MKILWVSRFFWEEHRRNGGQPGFFGELAQAIVARGIDLTILSQADDSGVVSEPRSIAGLNVHVYSRERRNAVLSPLDKLVKMWAGYRKGVTDAAMIRRFVRTHGPFDAVVAQCEEPDGLSCALASLLGRFPPLVTQVHDLRYQFLADRIRFIQKAALGFVFKKSARVVANSSQTAEWLRLEYGVPQGKIGFCRIHLTALFLGVARERTIAVAPDSRRILFLGALNRKKGPDIFLRAAILLAPELPGWTFVLVGPETSEDAAWQTTLKELAVHPSLSGRVEWLGRLKPSAVVEEILRARLVVCPSRIETFSRTTVEALALGRPVIVSETTGAASWVKTTDCGSVVAENDPTALADAMREWTSRDDAPNGSEKVTSQLTASLAADDWIREVRAAIQGHASGTNKLS